MHVIKIKIRWRIKCSLSDKIVPSTAEFGKAQLHHRIVLPSNSSVLLYNIAAAAAAPRRAAIAPPALKSPTAPLPVGAGDVLVAVTVTGVVEMRDRVGMLIVVLRGSAVPVPADVPTNAVVEPLLLVLLVVVVEFDEAFGVKP